MRKRLPELEMELTDELPGFSCRLCARCCRGKLVPLYPRDMERLDGLSGCIEETSAAEASLTGAGHKMKMADGRCVLLKGGRCTRYEIRPDTCRRHPFIVTGKNILIASTCSGIDWSRRQEGGYYAELSEGISRSMDKYLQGRDSRLGKG